MILKEFKIKDVRAVQIDPNHFSPTRKMSVDLVVEYYGQMDGHNTDDDVREAFYKSAKLMLDQIMKAANEST